MHIVERKLKTIMKSNKNLILNIVIAVFTFGLGITTMFNVNVNADTSNIIKLGTIINPNDTITMPDVEGDSKEYGTANGMFRYSESLAGGFYYDGMLGWIDLWSANGTTLTYVGTDSITINYVDGDGYDLLLNEPSQPETPSEINGIYEGTRELTQRLIFGDNELTTWQEGVLDTISILVTILVYLLPFILFFAVVKILLKP